MPVLGYRRILLDTPVAAEGGDSGGPLSVLNVEKLSLPLNTPLATQVAVSDSFYVSGFGDASDGFWITTNSGDSYHRALVPFLNDDSDLQCRYGYGDDSNKWAFGSNNNGYDVVADVHGDTPWDSTWTGVGLTLTHPATQQLAAASTAQGGVFVSGGTQDGVWVIDQTNYFGSPRPAYVLLGTSVASETHNTRWNGSDRWIINIDGVPAYYSLSDVATPDLATNWKNASDDQPAAITVTSVSVGNLIAGNKLGSVIRAVNGSTNGRNKYTDVLGVAPDITWDNTKWTDGTTNGSGNTAIPDIGTADPIAAEGNWIPYP